MLPQKGTVAPIAEKHIKRQIELLPKDVQSNNAVKDWMSTAIDDSSDLYLSHEGLILNFEET